MKTAFALLSVLSLLFSASVHAQMYKWVGADGKVTYSDAPPPASAKQVEKRASSGGAPADADLPYELSLAVKNNPVILYTTARCAPCDNGRSLLTARGIPYAEKTVSSNDDIARLKLAGGGNTQLPLLLVGRNRQTGFDSDGWASALTSAGYPESSKLPASYRNVPPEAAAPAPKPPVAAAPADRELGSGPVSGSPPPAAGNAPPGFRF
ncbi:MAG: glutaredoxin family protein [Pseudomonadota bacterium]